MRFSTKVTGITLLALLLAASVVWIAVYQADTRGNLSVSVLDGGKSSLILVRAPGGRTILIDGGADGSALRVLSSALPWWQRTIDLTFVAHVDALHIGGVPDIEERYALGQIVVPGASGAGPSWSAFQTALTDARHKGSTVTVAQRGDVLQIGGGAFLQILFPDRLLSGAQGSAGCIVARLVYGKNSFVFPCGTESVDEYVVRLDGTRLHSDVLVSPDATSSPLFSGFAGASMLAQKGETYVSDGQTVKVR